MKNEHEHHGLSPLSRLGSSGITALLLTTAAFGSASCEQKLPFLDGVTGPSEGSGSGERVSHVGQSLTTPANVTIRPKKFGRCLDLPSGSGVDATQYQSWECQTNNNQLFDMTYYAPDGSYTIKNKASGKCLWVLDGNDGRWVEQRACNNQDAHQRWWLNPKGNHEYQIQNVMDPQHYVCMDLMDGVNNDGAVIQSWSCNDNEGTNQNQRFNITNWFMDFEDQFNTFNTSNWAVQNVVEPGDVNTVSGANPTVAGGVLSLKMVNLVGDRISSKGKKEFGKGKWVARLRLLSNGTSGMAPYFKVWGSSYPSVCLSQPGAGALSAFQHVGNMGADQYSAGAVKGGVSGVTCNINDPDDGTWIDCCNEVDTQSLLKSSNANAVALGNWYDYSVESVGDDIYFTRTDTASGVETFIAQEQVGDNYPESMFAVLGYAASEAMTGTWTMEVDYVRHYSGCSGVSLYRGANYSDPYNNPDPVYLMPGDYTLADLQTLGATNDSLTSLKVPAYCTATLYWDDNFSGASLVKGADDSDLGNDGFNDQASSIRIR